MTNQEKIIVTGYTGIFMAKDFGDFHEDVEKRMNRPVYTHEMGDKEFSKNLKELYREDFLKLCAEETT
jgi:hypothetical protein